MQPVKPASYLQYMQQNPNQVFTESSSPWDAYQGYQGGFGNINSQADFDAYMNQFAQGSQTPGSAGYVAPQFDDTKAAGMYGTNQAASVYAQNNQPGQLTQSAYNQAGAFNSALPQTMKQVQGMMGVTNPFMQAFNNYGNAQDTRLDNTVDYAMGKAQDRLNSQFGGAGRSGSGMHANTMSEGLGNIANQMYSQNFQQNQARALQAAGMGSSAFQQDKARDLQAAGMMPQLEASRWMGINNMANLGQQQDQSPWDNLRNYASIVASMNGTQPPDRPESSSMDTVMGLAGMAGGLGWSPFG